MTNPERAAAALAAVFGDHELCDNIGSHFTCPEADQLATALLDLGLRTEAARFLAGHSGGDAGDDQHVWPMPHWPDENDDRVQAHLLKLSGEPQLHMCEVPGCMSVVRFDSEPFCLPHSPGVTNYGAVGDYSFQAKCRKEQELGWRMSPNEYVVMTRTEQHA